MNESDGCEMNKCIVCEEIKPECEVDLDICDVCLPLVCEDQSNVDVVIGIRKFDDPILKVVCKAVQDSEFRTRELDGMIENMVKSMIEFKGIGLAAPQIGISKRIIILTDHNNLIIPMINPVWTKKWGNETLPEGCLSYPEVYREIPRAIEIVVYYFDANGEKHHVMLFRLQARIFQHELDHLDGSCKVSNTKYKEASFKIKL